MLKFYTYSQPKQDSIISQFWEDYFALYPETGSLTELNNMRIAHLRKSEMTRKGIPDYEMWKRLR